MHAVCNYENIEVTNIYQQVMGEDCSEVELLCRILPSARILL